MSECGGVRGALVVAASASILGWCPGAIAEELERPERPRLLERSLSHFACTLRGLPLPARVAGDPDRELLPPAQFEPFDPNARYTVDDTIWVGEAQIGPSWEQAPAHLTFSFPDDGTIWGLASVSATSPNVLNSAFESAFGPGNKDLGREIIRQAFAGWALATGNTYREVADDNSQMDEATARQPGRGDIRIGGIAFGEEAGFVAYNAFPTATILGVGGADMAINTSFLNGPGENGTILALPNCNYRIMRNVAAHEHGHGLGFLHQTPCYDFENAPIPMPFTCQDVAPPAPYPPKLMEPLVGDLFDGLQFDERRGGAANYGDRFAPNHTVQDAHDFGVLDDPAPRSVIEQYLATMAPGNGSPDEDWFRFTITQDQPFFTVVVDPGLYLTTCIGNPPVCYGYETGVQFLGCTGLFFEQVFPNEAGNLTVELRTADGQTLLNSSTPGSPGIVRFLFEDPLPAGEYTIRVTDVGNTFVDNLRTQLYDLKIFLDQSPKSPVASAGVSKRVEADTNCFFLGAVNSRSIDFPSTVLPDSAFDWDTDGDGSFETTGQANPVAVYPSNGVYPVSLRVTDANGLATVDSIDVTVFGATTTLGVASPMRIPRGLTTQIGVAGTNLRNATDSGHFSVSGAGAAPSGVPDPNPLGTEVTLVVDVDAGAALGLRDLSVSNSDGSATSPGAIEIVEDCPGDANFDGVVDFADLTTTLGEWLSDYGAAIGPGDADRDGTVGFADVTTVLGNWLTPCP